MKDSLIVKFLSEKMSIIYMAIIALYIIYFAIFGYFGCNEKYGIGISTPDGVCENYIYGYSIISEISAILAPFVIVIIILKVFGKSYAKAFGFSILLFIFSLVIDKIIAFFYF